ncbi:hypothetical protein [Phormidium sp. CCY1219]|nr:hypothetical protein [Phormidium sp. CCY1219]
MLLMINRERSREIAHRGGLVRHPRDPMPGVTPPETYVSALE